MYVFCTGCLSFNFISIFNSGKQPISLSSLESESTSSISIASACSFCSGVNSPRSMSLIDESFGMITGFVLSGGEVSEVLVFGNSVFSARWMLWMLLVYAVLQHHFSLWRHFDFQSQVSNLALAVLFP